MSDAAQPITGARNPLEFPVSRSFLRCRGLPRPIPVSGDKSFLQLSGRPAQEVCANNLKKISCPHAHPHLPGCYPPTRRILHRSIHSSVHSQPTVTESSGSLYRQSGATPAWRAEPLPAGSLGQLGRSARLPTGNGQSRPGNFGPAGIARELPGRSSSRLRLRRRRTKIDVRLPSL